MEFGISEIGMSTSIFLDLCKKNNGKLTSVDTNKNSRSFQDANWKFINTRDDNFGVIEKYIDKELDVIYLDTIQNESCEKIIYNYYEKLKVGGFFFVDDTSWLPYLKNRKDHFFYGS